MKVPPPRARVAAAETVEIGFTVNGSAATVTVPPRMHLADALRERLGLTGTHLGCEHGVCGMCTVLVDGDAARACLLFAVQCEGSEIVTVEGLGTAERQHPLQRALSAHHGLQCGFCTPGMLISSYDLLAHQPGVGPDELPTAMSGVLCRCTGYRGILAAVADVAATHPDGIPGPGNCTARTLAGRAGGRSGPAPAVAPEVEVAPTAAGPTTVEIPTGTPTTRVQVTSTLGADVDAVWAVLADPARVVACLPGAELVQSLDADRHRGRARVALGPVTLSFEGLAQFVERDAAVHRMRLVGHGTDAGGSATRADIRIAADPAPGGGTVLAAQADLFLSGRIAQFGRALAGDVSRRLFEQFAVAVDESARTGGAPTPAPSPLRMALGALRDALHRRLTDLRRGLTRRR